MSKKYVIFDLDGTLININSCQHLIGDWDEFHPATLQCPPHERMVEFAQLMSGVADLMIVTGKNDTHRQAVFAWLRKHKVYPVVMLMRPDLNLDSDPEVKIKQLRLFLGSHWQERILFAVEDRDKMVDAWRAQGITCLQCGPSLY